MYEDALLFIYLAKNSVVVMNPDLFRAENCPEIE